MNWGKKIFEDLFGERNYDTGKDLTKLPVLQICLILSFVAFLVIVLNGSGERKNLFKLAQATCKLKMPEMCGSDPYCKADPSRWCEHLSTFCYENSNWEDTRCNFIGLH